MSKIYKVIDLALRLGLDNATISVDNNFDENYFNNASDEVEEPRKFDGEWLSFICDDDDLNCVDLFLALKPDAILEETSDGRILLFKF